MNRVLTWNELADLYDAAHPGSARPARTMPMDAVFNWAEGQTDMFAVLPNGTICLVEKNQPMKPNRIIVAGSRGFDDYTLLNIKLTHILQRLTPDDTAIISGTAKGADIMGEHWAAQHGFEVMRFPADWEKHGRSAGMIRNEEMAAAATHLIAFWDQKSPGTFNMIQEARERGLKVVVIRY